MNLSRNQLANIQFSYAGRRGSHNQAAAKKRKQKAKEREIKEKENRKMRERSKRTKQQ